jgi:hypothetical protein
MFWYIKERKAELISKIVIMEYLFYSYYKKYLKNDHIHHGQQPPEPSTSTHIRTINIVIKNLDPTEFPSDLLNDLRTQNLLNNYIKKNMGLLLENIARTS